MLLEELAEPVVDDVLDHRAHLGGDQLVLGLARELGVRDLDREHAGQPFAAIIAGECHLFLLGQTGARSIGVDLPGEGGAEAGQVGAAVTLGYVVGEAKDRLVIAVGPLQRSLDGDAVAFGGNEDRRLEKPRLGAVEIGHVSFEPAVVMQLDAALLGRAVVDQHDAYPRIQKGQLTQSMFQGRGVEVGHGEDLARGQEGDLRSRPLTSIAHLRQGGLDFATTKTDEMLLAVAPNRQLQPFRQGVDDGNANAVQAAGDLV